MPENPWTIFVLVQVNSFNLLIMKTNCHLLFDHMSYLTELYRELCSNSQNEESEKERKRRKTQGESYRKASEKPCNEGITLDSKFTCMMPHLTSTSRKLWSCGQSDTERDICSMARQVFSCTTQISCEELH